MIAELIEKILKDLREHKVHRNLIFAPEMVSEEGGHYLGYFSDGDPLDFSVAIKDPEWFTTFVHEYCHFLQYKEGKFIGDVAEKINNFDEWLAGSIELEPEALEESTRLYQLCELDCEQRTVALLKEHKIVFDYETYIQDANAYVLSYEIIRCSRKELTGFRQKAKSLCPTEFITDITALPAGFAELAGE